MWLRFADQSSARMRLYTHPQYVSFLQQFSDPGAIVDLSALAAVPSGTPVFDLHDRSCRLAGYRRLARRLDVRFCGTLARLDWLGRREPPAFEPRDHGAEPIYSYWSRVLACPSTARHQAAASAFEPSDCGEVLLAFQSTTATKSLAEPLAVAVATFLNKRFDRQPHLIEGPGRPYAPSFLAQVESTVRITRIRDPARFADLARTARLLVSVDSGLRHVAALAGTPRVVIYGPTSPETCGSGDGEYAIAVPLPCAPCGALATCTNSIFAECMRDPTVLDQLDALLSTVGQ